MKWIYLGERKEGNYSGLGRVPSSLRIHSSPYSLTSYPKARQNLRTLVLEVSILEMIFLRGLICAYFY
jgi:hypothetical protein